MNFFEKLKATWNLKGIRCSPEEGDELDLRIYIICSLLYILPFPFLLSQKFTLEIYILASTTGIILIWFWYEIIKLNYIKFALIWKEN